MRPVGAIACAVENDLASSGAIFTYSEAAAACNALNAFDPLAPPLHDVGCFEVRDDEDGTAPYWYGGAPGWKDNVSCGHGVDLVLEPGSESWPVGSRVEGWVMHKPL